MLKINPASQPPLDLADRVDEPGDDERPRQREVPVESARQPAAEESTDDSEDQCGDPAAALLTRQDQLRDGPSDESEDDEG